MKLHFSPGSRLTVAKTVDTNLLRHLEIVLNPAWPWVQIKTDPIYVQMSVG